jgi:hypothetical protein
LRAGQRRISSFIYFAIDFVLELLQLVLAGDLLHQQRTEPFDRIAFSIGDALGFRAIKLSSSESECE